MITAKEAGEMHDLIKEFPVNKRPVRVDAFKDKWVERAGYAESRVHQLECELRKMREITLHQIAVNAWVCVKVWLNNKTSR